MSDSDESWLDAETMPVLSWERVDKYCQLSKPKGYSVCAVKCAAGEEFVFEAWHKNQMLKPWLMKAEDARAECQAHAIAAWRKHNKAGS